MAKTEAKKVPKSYAEKAAVGSKKTAVVSADSKLAALEPPKNLGSACVGFDIKEIRAKSSSVVDMLSITRLGDDLGGGSSENAVLVDFKDPENVALVYLRAGASVTLKVSAKVFRPGAFVVDASLFRAIKGNSPFLVLASNTKSNSVKFRCGGTRGSVQMLNTPDDYLTAAPVVGFKANIVLPKGLVTEVFSRLMFNSFDPGLPAIGLPLDIRVGKSVMNVTACDNLVGAMYTRPEKALPDFNICVPGSAFLKIAKHIEADILKFGYNDSAFRIRSKGLDVIHPIIPYDLVDLDAWLAEEMEKKPKFEMVLPTLEFIDAIDNAMSMSAIDKTESKITIEFEESKGRVIFLGSNTQAKTNFPINKMLKSGKSMNIITNGKRITGFVNILKSYPEFRLRVGSGRAFLFAPDNSFSFLVPLA